MTYEEFRKKVLRIGESHTHEINNSYGVRDGYKYYRQIRPKQSKYVLKDSQYYSVIRSVNKLLAQNILQGAEVKFPHKMGGLELRKTNRGPSIKNGKIVVNYPIDWDKTIKLWSEDEEAHKNKTLIRIEEKEVFTVLYNKSIATYKNKTFYQFSVNRELRRSLKDIIKQNVIDAFQLWQNNNKV